MAAPLTQLPSNRTINQKLKPLVDLVAMPAPGGDTNTSSSALERYEYARQNWDDIVSGVNTYYLAISQAMRDRNIAAANVANPENWWNKSLGHAKDPPWMQGQKDIVAAYPGKLADYRGNLLRYRAFLQRWLAETLVLAVYAPIWYGPTSTVFPLPSMMDPSGLLAAWPGDPDAVRGRIPKALRGELLVGMMAAAREGRLPLDLPVPWWLLGLTQQEYLSILSNNPGAIPSYGDMTQAIGL